MQNLGSWTRVDLAGGIHMGSNALVIPWTYLTAMVLGLPLLAWLLAAGFTRSRAALTRRTD